ncbi:hypothetical protein BKA56DRAFT_598829 [Ilyonectria sp. MPI-CAGE-AT-0026]|nr:hypothetical protein BKA56DRAFT_598829 [Ilyonectria sp. MPI-CAGE-AT-0026]
MPSPSPSTRAPPCATTPPMMCGRATCSHRLVKLAQEDTVSVEGIKASGGSVPPPVL